MKFHRRKGTAPALQNNISGFTLVEVLITFAITAISLVMILQLFSIGLRSSVSSCNYSTAVIHAREKMEELYVEPSAGSGSFEDDFNWTTAVEPFAMPEVEPDELEYNVLKLRVNITWKESSKKKSFELVTLRTFKAEDE